MANLHALSDRGSIQPSLVGALQDAVVFRALPTAIETFMDLITVTLKFVFNVDNWPRFCRGSSAERSARAGSHPAGAGTVMR
jgi:hypothetical protein